MKIPEDIKPSVEAQLVCRFLLLIVVSCVLLFVLSLMFIKQPLAFALGGLCLLAYGAFGPTKRR